MIPRDPVVWIVIAAGLVIVTALAIWFGRGFEIGKWYIRVKQAEPKKQGSVVVGKGLQMNGGKVGGDIAGIKQTGGAATDVSAQDVDVLSGAKMTNVDVAGDITGIRQQQDAGEKK